MFPQQSKASKGYVYIIADDGHSVIAIATTTNLKLRMKRYAQITRHIKLIYYEKFATRAAARKRERQLRQLAEKEKFDLIRRHNPQWRDLTGEL